MGPREASALMAVLALSWGFTSRPLAQSTPPTGPGSQTTPSEVTGTLLSSTGAWLEIRSDDGGKRTFEVDQRSLVPAGMVAGTRVKVEYYALERGRYHAIKLTLAGASTEPFRPPSPSPSPTPSPTPTPTPSPKPTPDRLQVES